MTEKEELQYLFNKAYNHIMAQGQPSYYNGSCMYRSDNGLQCAAGPFIIGYREWMEDKTFCEITEKFDEEHFDPIAFKHSHFVELLQKCHDNHYHYLEDKEFIEAYQDDMQQLLDKYGLSVPKAGE